MTQPDIRQAVILVGGRGTRLGGLTDTTPKPLLPVAGRPFVEYLLDMLSGMQQIILSCGHLAEQFQSCYQGKRWGSAQVQCAIEASPAGTGGALALLAERLDERFFLLNGDSILAVDFGALQAALDADPQRQGVLALIEHPPGPPRYGSVTLQKDGRISGFAPRGAADGLISAGVCALRRSVARSCAVPSSLESDLLPQLAVSGQLGGVSCSGGFIDIGVPEDLERAQSEVPQIAAGQRP